MTIKEIATLLDANVVAGADKQDDEIEKCFASDLMSDVLTLKDTPLLVSGLCNMQTIRTCDMAGIDYIIIVRGKKITDDMIEEAEENGMVLMGCRYSLFKTCGLLYAAGLKPMF